MPIPALGVPIDAEPPIGAYIRSFRIEPLFEPVPFEDARDDHGPEWDDADDLMRVLRERLEAVDGDPAALRDALDELDS